MMKRLDLLDVPGLGEVKLLEDHVVEHPHETVGRARGVGLAEGPRRYAPPHDRLGHVVDLVELLADAGGARAVELRRVDHVEARLEGVRGEGGEVDPDEAPRCSRRHPLILAWSRSLAMNSRMLTLLLTAASKRRFLSLK